MLISVDVAGMIAIGLIIHVHKWAIVDQFERATRSILEKTRTWPMSSLSDCLGRGEDAVDLSVVLSHLLKSEMAVDVCAYARAASFSLSFATRTLTRRAAWEIRKEEEKKKTRAADGRASDEWEGTTTHPHRVQCARAHTHTHARVARITFGFISRMLIFQNKRRRTDGSRRRQFCSVARARSDPGWHTHARTPISIGWVERE